jgi:dTDP-4-dehydrorhamnose 3,5-epimerase
MSEHGNVRRPDDIQDVVIIEPTVYADERGYFAESFRSEWIPEAQPFVQHNCTERRAGALVGLHYHRFQADYWYAPKGRVLVGLYDLRVSSPTRGHAMSFEIGPHVHRGVYIPHGIAHGFHALTDVILTYAVDNYYDPADELGVKWDDPVLGIHWQAVEPVLSARDQGNLDPKMLPE